MLKYRNDNYWQTVDKLLNFLIKSIIACFTVRYHKVSDRAVKARCVIIRQ